MLMVIIASNAKRNQYLAEGCKSSGKQTYSFGVLLQHCGIGKFLRHRVRTIFSISLFRDGNQWTLLC